MLNWLRKTFYPPQPAPDAALPEGWFAPLPAEDLLAIPHREGALRQLRQLTPLPDPLFDDWLLTAIRRLAGLVQQFPASRGHHHAHPGGLLDHALEVSCHAARLRQGYLLPPEAGAEEQARQASAWTVAVVCAALLHDVGKVTVDMEIRHISGTPWHPWQGELLQPYRWHYRTGQDYHLHPAAGALLASNLLPSPLLDWLAGFPAVFAALVYQLTGHSERAGMLAELVQQADQASVARNLGGDMKTALVRPPASLPRQLRAALRALVQDEYRLNNPDSGSDGWLTEDTLWLVSKTTADRVRAWLLQHGVTGVPKNNNRLFDELLAQQLIVANDDKAIWRCTVRSDHGWSPAEPLTLLRLSPSVIWEHPEQRPACFAGNVSPACERPPAPELRIPAVVTAVLPQNAQPAVHDNFLTWLKRHVSTPGAVNTRQGKVHIVDDHLFLVTPGIFRLYIAETTGDAGDGWKLAQKTFQDSGLALRCNEDSFIWTCDVKAPRKTSQLKGFLMQEPGLVFGENVPVNNPWVRLVTEQGQKPS